ncbi:MAG: Hsp20/alpha crystallin family protein [Gemmatimonadaceae bacterium]
MIYRTSLSALVFGLRREIDRLFEDTFSRGDGVNSWSAAVDVSETDKELRLDLEIPGIKPEDVDITAENSVLTVRGEKRGENKEGDDHNRDHLVERSYGSFARSFQLPEGLDDSKIEADMDRLVSMLPNSEIFGKQSVFFEDYLSAHDSEKHARVANSFWSNPR